MMGHWLLRLGQMALGVWALASLVFLLSHLGPVQADTLALPDASDFSHSTTSYQALDQVARQRLGLDQPLFYLSRVTMPSGTVAWHWHGTHNQYHRWASAVLRGQLGSSLRNGQPVAGQLLQATGYTLPVVGSAFVIALLASLYLAQRLATQPWWRAVVRPGLVALQAVPLFVVALGLLFAFANPEALYWFVPYGLAPPPDAEASGLDVVGSYFRHATLPIISLVITAIPALTLQLEASLQHELGQLYILAARAKGLTTYQIIRHHALRNSLLPLLTQLTELLPVLVAGAVVVEVVFALPGMGQLLVRAAATRDYPLLVGGVLCTGTARLLALFLADALYPLADPRLR